MHILFLTDNFPPEVNAPASRTFEHCREWVKAGHKVTVITCVPNFPRGKVYPGYKNKFIQKEKMDGIEVIRVWTYIAANQGTLRRMLDYISFMPAAILSSLGVRKPDLVIGTSPQFFTVCAAWVVSVLKRIPFVFELRDIWPESIRAVGALKSGPLLRILEHIEMFLYNRAAQIICVTHSFKYILNERGINTRKIRVVKNGVDLARFLQMDRDKTLAETLGLRGSFIVGYVGTHGLAHRLETILDAAKITQERDLDICYLFVGDGAQKASLKRKAAKQKLSNVYFLDSVDKEEVRKYWSLLNISIIHLKDDALFQSVIPSKLFECMAMGIPVLHGVRGESAEIVEKTGCGLMFQPENASELADKIIALKQNPFRLKQMAKAGQKGALQNDRCLCASQMLSHLIEVTSSIKIRCADGKAYVNKLAYSDKIKARKLNQNLHNDAP